jgi:hypothetical protein
VAPRKSESIISATMGKVLTLYFLRTVILSPKKKGLILQIIRDDKNENTRVNIEFGKAKQDKEILIFINIVLALFITLIRKERNILVLVGCSLTIGVHRTTGVQLNIRIQVFVNKRRFLSNFERMKMKIKKNNELRTQ